MSNVLQRFTHNDLQAFLNIWQIRRNKSNLKLLGIAEQIQVSSPCMAMFLKMAKNTVALQVNVNSLLSKCFVVRLFLMSIE